MNKMVLKGNVVLPDKIIPRGFVSIEGEKIVGISDREDMLKNEDGEFIDYGESYIAPGLIDLHLHGALGRDVMDCQEESLRQIAVHQARCGVTGFLGSTMSASSASILRAIETIKKASRYCWPSQILGVHIEGPFLSRERKGAQDPDYLKGMENADIERLAAAVQGLKSVISLAPEVDDNMRFIPQLKENGFVVAIGHTDATYEQAMESFKRGITHATHLFNAMSGFNHREPGVVGAVLDSDEVTAELIADGIHLHPAALRLALAKKGAEKLCLVTDSLKASGAENGIYRWGNLEIEVKGLRATIKGSGVLAGSVLALNRAIKNMMDWTKISLSQAINMASLYPARVLGLGKEIGSIQPGKNADLAIFDPDLGVSETVLKGRLVSRVFKEVFRRRA